LLLSLLIDNADDHDVETVWNLYYHFYLDEKSLRLLRIQARKLHDLAASMQTWHSSQYGKPFRICDIGTLVKVRQMWNFYSLDDKNTNETSFKMQFTSEIQKAKKAKDTLAHGVVLTGFRSAVPAHLNSLAHLSQIYEHFWENGTTDAESTSTSRIKHPNPMFSCPDTDTFTLHYGTDPLLGFHLATAYAPLASTSPLRPETLESSPLRKLVEVARIAFRAWANSFRKITSRNILTLRFVVGDAIAFCHALQHKRITGDIHSANWYRDGRHVESLVLDGEDYDNGTAPLCFNCIDTSNLADHVGILNLLIATSPLLEHGVAASLYTEIIVRKEKTYKDLIDGLLCGHLPTVSILLGLFPVEYYTNASAVSTVDDILFNTATSSATRNLPGIVDLEMKQMFVRLTWKRPVAPPTSASLPAIRLDGVGLAYVFYNVYLRMFQGEDLGYVFSHINLLALQKQSLLQYNRASYVSFLRLVKSRVATDWNEVTSILLNLIENNSSIRMGMNYMQELYLYLHLLDLHCVDTLSRHYNCDGIAGTTGDVRDWRHMPPVVCVTLKIPRAKLRVFTSLEPLKLGTPPVHCIVQSPQASATGQWQNLFAAIQLSFGEVTTTGTPHSEAFKIRITEDERGWNGKSPLLVSFYCPSWILLQEPRTATVAFGVQSTPHSAGLFMNTLGTSLKVFETYLGDEKQILITKTLPNLLGTISVYGFPDSDVAGHEVPNPGARTIISADVNNSTGQIVSLTGRLEILSEEARIALRNGAHITTVWVSPCNFVVIFGDRRFRFNLDFPGPVLDTKKKIRIARKSSYIEILAPLADSVDWPSFPPSFMYPVFLDGNRKNPVSWNAPRLNLDTLPVLDVTQHAKLQWLITHVSLMFSDREGALRKTGESSSMYTELSSNPAVRLSFKSSLFVVFMRFTRLQGGPTRATVFGINNTETSAGLHLLLIPSTLRLDPGGRTIVLDTAVLPLYDELMPRPEIRQFLAALSRVGILQLNVDDAALRAWKSVLPAMVERCRATWTHREDCAYVVGSEQRIPLSVESGQNPLCTCGNGKLPPGFVSADVPGWNHVAKYAVRAAVAPSFSIPYIEICEGSTVGPGNERGTGGATTVAASVEECRVCGRDKAFLIENSPTLI